MSENLDTAADLVANMNINSVKNEEVSAAIRAARTMVGREPEKHQNEFLQHSEMIVKFSGDFFLNYSSKGFEEKDFRSMTQLLHNLCVGQKEFSRDLWTEHKDFLLEAFTKNHEGATVNVLSAIILQMVINGVFEKENREVVKHLVAKLTASILKIFSEDVKYDFPLLALKKVIFLSKGEEFTKIYEGLDSDQRFLLLDVLAEEKGDDLPADVVTCIARQFKSKARILLTVLSTKQTADPQETVKLINLVCCLSHIDRFRPNLQGDKSLLIDAVYLLRMVHDLGKEEKDGIFAPVNKITDIAQKDKWESEPVYGFKRDLVRLLGNLCYNHKDNQDELRENNGIELILDCSPVDGKNPYIQQWVIFAIRNICLGNQENQAVLYSINKKGKVDEHLMEKVGVEIKEL